MLDWLACALVRCLTGLLCLLPPGLTVWLGERFGLLVYWLLPKRAGVGRLNLRAAFPGQLSPAQAGRIIRDCYKQLGGGFAEMLRLPVIDRAYIDRYVAIEGRPQFERAAASGRPAIFLTGHYGNWEFSSITAALLGYPIVALARAQEKLPNFYRLMVSYRESKGCRIIHKGGAMKRLIAALGQHQLIGIVGDQANRQGIPVKFFGRPALFATGPFELAYGCEALIFPAFIHRVRGPFHRLVIEPPLVLSHDGPRDDAVRAGIERFASVLERHIRESPHQWLWMHKRWKHTTARRVMVLSDGKAGHVKQSLAVVEAMRQRVPDLAHEVVEVRYRSAAARAAVLLWSWWMPRGSGSGLLRWALTPETAATLLTRHADVFVSCGSSTVPVNLLWAEANQAKSVAIMNPSPLPLKRFSLVIAPRHDRLPKRSNVVQTVGALVGEMPDDALRSARERLRAHPKFRASRDGEGRGGLMRHQRPVIAVFIGGDTLHYEINPTFAEQLVGQVLAVCEAVDGWCLVTTSRRTSPAVEQVLAARLAHHPRCRLLLIASRDPLNGTMEGMLGSADAAVVTGESISMVSEACASGRRVVIVEPPRRSTPPSKPGKHQRFLRDVAREGYGKLVPLGDLGLAVHSTLGERRQPSRRLDSLAAVRDAVARLF